LLLHVSASMCRHQGARMLLLSYVSRQGAVHKILMVFSSVYYVAVWRVSVCPVSLPRAYSLSPWPRPYYELSLRVLLLWKVYCVGRRVSLWTDMTVQTLAFKLRPLYSTDVQMGKICGLVSSNADTTAPWIQVLLLLRRHVDFTTPLRMTATRGRTNTSEMVKSM
jgi:hypothetical protein